VRAFLVFSVFALLAAACGDDGSVSVHGRLLEADGSPAVGYRVSLAGFQLEGTMDLETVTDPDGRYELSGALRPLGSDDLRLDVSFLAPEGDLRVEVSVPAVSGDHTIPDQRVWDDQLALTPLPEGGLRATWSAAPEGAPTGYQLEMFQAGPTTALELPSWRGYALPLGSYDLPAELIEDRFASVQLFAGDENPQFFCHKDLCVKWLSTRVDTSQGSLVPISRGASCTASVGGDGERPLLGKAGAPCALTDGYVDFGAWRPEDWVCGVTPCSDVHQVTIDLGAAVPVYTIVLRYLYLADDHAAFVEVSDDGSSFGPIATVDDTAGIIYERVHLDVPVTTRFIRITPAAGGTIAALAELSAF
jgi:hypothetical protein